MRDIEQILADTITGGEITLGIRVHADYLRELSMFTTDRPAWRAKWAAYAANLADGPTTAEEFESIRAERRAGGTGDRRAKP
jgi:hypothetical protein